MSYERAFDLMVADRVDGLMASEGSENTPNRQLIVDLDLGDVFRRVANITTMSCKGQNRQTSPSTSKPSLSWC